MKDFDTLEPGALVKFKIDGVEHEVREPSELTCCRYEAARTRGARWDEHGKFLGIQDEDQYVRARLILLGGCLARVGEKGPVGEDAVQAMPRRLTAGVFAEALRLYDAANDGDAAKN